MAPRPAPPPEGSRPQPAPGPFRAFPAVAAMAEEVLALRERLLFQTTCSVCLELFTEPVLTACGHSFCQQCLAGVLGHPPRSAACPQCRAPVQPGSVRPNRSLGDVAEAVRSLGEVAAWPRCPQHGKPLALFCEPCAALVCALCRDGPEHRLHRFRPAEEAARELRVRGGAARGAGGLGGRGAQIRVPSGHRLGSPPAWAGVLCGHRSVSCPGTHLGPLQGQSGVCSGHELLWVWVWVPSMHGWVSSEQSLGFTQGTGLLPPHTG